VAAWCDRFTEECRRRGIRVTAQRTAVFRAVVQDPAHPTAETVHRRVLPHLGSMSLATVYRTLEFLVRTGLLHRVSTPQAISRFDAKVSPHHHLVCRSCGWMRDLEKADFDGVRLPRGRLAGFRAESLDVRVVGLCDACAQAPPAAGKRPSVIRKHLSRARRKDAPSKED